MKEIRVLDKQTVDQIAAGEVVERPASVVKELVENAIDAEATAITVEIRDGGTTLIRITDNGTGIPSEQLRTAFLRHATSKIRKVEDLVQITSLGFRGEALSSIASVAQVECITKPPEALTGIRYCIEGGQETAWEEVGAPGGTTFLVRNLFYNTPARQKFLKSPAAEGSRIATVVEELALSHPEISVKFIQNGQNKLYTGGNGNLKEIIYQVYGREITKSLLPFSLKNAYMEITGYLGSPLSARGNRSLENYFVNGRYVKSPLIAKAIEDGYHGFLMQHRYPFTLLYIHMDGERVDVNVHPAKMELRFSCQEEIYQALCLGIKNALMQKERIPEVSLADKQRFTEVGKKDQEPPKKDSVPEPFELERKKKEASGSSALVAEKAPAYGSHSPAGKTEPVSGEEMIPEIPDMPVSSSLSAAEKTAEKNSAAEKGRTDADTKKADAGHTDMHSCGEKSEKPDDVTQKKTAEPAGEQQTLFPEKMLSASARPMYRLIGQVFDTYWLIEYDNALFIIDQHAAHEKVLYEKLMAGFRDKTIRSQMLYPSAVVELTSAESALLAQNTDAFASLGFEIEFFGGHSWKINAVPADLYDVPADALFMDTLAELGSQAETIPAERILEKLASMSCKAAIKGNHAMSVQEAEALIDSLLQLENPYNCPHGRPTIISMSRYEMDKKFKRIVS